MSRIDRRLATLLISAGALPAQIHKQPQPKGGFFTKEELRFLESMAEALIPGSRDAGVAAFVDLTVTHSAPAVQREWREACRALMSGEESADALVARGAAEEGAPVSVAGKFFQKMKPITVFAYYTSEAGLRNELGYLGGHATGPFPGCRE